MHLTAQQHEQRRSTPGPILTMSKDASQRADHEDIEKISSFLAGDESAFEFLFDKYRERVYGIAFRFVRNKEDALEVTQDVFIRVYQGLAKFKTDSKFYTWLYRIATHRAIDYIRSRKAHPAVTASTLESAAGDEGGSFTDRGPDSRAVDPSETMHRREMEHNVLAAVDQLSEKHRAVFVLHAIEQLAYKEIAEVVGCSIGTVMSRLFYARKKLQDLLKEYT